MSMQFPKEGAVLLCGLILFAGSCMAGTFEQSFSAQATEEYVTNPLLNPADQGRAAWSTTLQPGYTLRDVHDTYSLQASAQLQLVRSSDTALIANRQNPNLSLLWQKPNERGGLDVSALYSRASTLMTEPIAAGLISANSTSTSRSLSANWRRMLSDRSTLIINGAYGKTTFSGNNASASLSNYSTRSAGLRFEYALNDRSTPFINLSYVESRPDNGSPTTQQHNVSLGINWKASSQLEYSVNAGASRLSSAGTGNTTNSQYGASMEYKAERTNLSLEANHQATPSGLGSGSFIMADVVNGNLGYDLSLLDRISLDASWRKSNYLAGSLQRSMGVQLHHDLNPDWSIKTYLQHSTNNQANLGQASSNSLGVTLSYAGL